MEFGLDTTFASYSGGLGILAGDHLKAAHDAQVPLVGIGIRWKQGYHEQAIDEDGRPYDSYRSRMYPFLEDTGIVVTVPIRKNIVHCKVWKVDCFGNAPLYLLDTDVPENGNRWITGQLYGWFGEERVAQELVLGVGGVKALEALGIKPDVYHFNEGHAALAGLELIRQEMEKGVPFHQAWRSTREKIVFTTHTPVEAGNETHSHELLEYMGGQLGLTIQQMHEIGGTPFNMTVAGLRLCRGANAVAQLHGETACEMWKPVNNRPEIIAITNGVHNPTWQAPEIVSALPSKERIWDAHQALKIKTINFIAERSGVKLDPEALLIGFSRRAATYKRSDLIFADESVIAPLLRDRKVQIVFSGKAHPLDEGGKAIIHTLVKMMKQYPESVVFLVNYDMEIGALLTRGCDVWLNNPRRPMEACGTSGMKAAMNGVLNLSILDGWWPEACEHGVNGWQISDEVVPATTEEQDKRDAASLYSVLTKSVIPTYYDDRAKWKQMMIKSIESTQDAFSADRMIREYYERLYVKG
jgi:starch phosphorylase